MKVLIVDDSNAMRMIVKRTLREAGFGHLDVEQAGDGNQALDCIHKAAPDLILSDWNMPNMQGIDLLKACKAEAALKDTPFMLVTAEGEQKQIVEAAKAGVSDYVVKPFNAQTLKEKLQKVYDRHHGKAA